MGGRRREAAGNCCKVPAPAPPRLKCSLCPNSTQFRHNLHFFLGGGGVHERCAPGGAADQIRPSSCTAARSDSSSATEASMRARENSEMSRPCTMDQSPPDVVTGKELTSPSGTP